MWNFFSRHNRFSHTGTDSNAEGQHSSTIIASENSVTTKLAEKTAFATNRLKREFSDLNANPLQNVKLLTQTALHRPSNWPSIFKFLCEWIVEVKGVSGTVYEGETYKLRFRFTERYPMDSPEVTFVDTSPAHKHVYSNGHICLSILYDGWSPALSVASICLSVLSMLSSSEAKERPPDDKHYVTLCGHHVSPKSMRWIFDDDTI